MFELNQKYQREQNFSIKENNMSSYFYLHVEMNDINAAFLNNLEDYAEKNKSLIYALDRPLTDSKYRYGYTDGLIILSPKHKIAIVNFGNNTSEFENYVDDVLEDIGSISDKYLYKDAIGRPRQWRNSLVESSISKNDIEDIETFLNTLKLEDNSEVRKLDLLISLFIGSINDIERVRMTTPQTPLDKIKQKIQLFDGDQTRFIYKKFERKRVIIQGLSGTGKTELLLHKLKDIYTEDSKSRIFFTCHTKILADNLRKRIPAFFNFLKVEQQIEWESRLWCSHAWGSSSNPNSGVYSYVCSFYKIPFRRYATFVNDFEEVCRIAIQEIESKYEKDNFKFAFTHLFIDESQDFGEKFFALCDLVTEKQIFIAGDIFQSIFDVKLVDTISSDVLLGKCYRTDPRTLMFAHALGMGLFEERKIRWLEKNEWEGCGYSVEINENKYYLSREPIRRFEDLDIGFKSIEIIEAGNHLISAVITTLKTIQSQNYSVLPDDIGIIILDENTETYKLADNLEVEIQFEFDWNVNKAYETKENISNSVLISNRNNVKGLEFPFVICVTNSIRSTIAYRNSLYTMLTRSFLKSYLIVPSFNDSGVTEGMIEGLREIMENHRMIVEAPTEEEKIAIRTRFDYRVAQHSLYEKMMQVFDTLKVDKQFHEKLLQTSKELDLREYDVQTLISWTKDMLKYISNN